MHQGTEQFGFVVLGAAHQSGHCASWWRRPRSFLRRACSSSSPTSPSLMAFHGFLGATADIALTRGLLGFGRDDLSMHFAAPGELRMTTRITFPSLAGSDVRISSAFNVIEGGAVVRRSRWVSPQASGKTPAAAEGWACCRVPTVRLRTPFARPVRTVEKSVLWPHPPLWPSEWWRLDRMSEITCIAPYAWKSQGCWRTGGTGSTLVVTGTDDLRRPACRICSPSTARVTFVFRLLHAEHTHGHAVVAVQAERGLVHDSNVTGQRLVVGQCVQALGRGSYGDQRGIRRPHRSSPSKTWWRALQCPLGSHGVGREVRGRPALAPKITHAVLSPCAGWRGGNIGLGDLLHLDGRS